MSELSKVREKIRLPSRHLNEFSSLDDGKRIGDYLLEFGENVQDILADYAGLDPSEVTIRTDCGDYLVMYQVYASLMETDKQFEDRMVKLDALEAEAARLIEEAKIIKSLAYDSELGEYIRLREKFKLYEVDK